jgi:histidinol-phosphate aminotransferase
VEETGLSDLLRPELAELSAYLPVQGEFAIRLDANEAPPLLGDAARARLAAAAAATAWERYPDARHAVLRAAIAARCGVTPEHVLVGVGSDEIIALLTSVVCRPRTASQPPTVLTTTPTFVMYRMSARVRGLRVIEVPLDDAWDIAEKPLLYALEMAPPNLLFVASPNNPTGRLADRSRLVTLIEAARGALVVIDEAYIDYAGVDHLELFHAYPHVAILRTLSKVGFAAIRIGWLLARPSLIAELDKARPPYNIAAPCQALGALALGELAPELEGLTRAVVTERERMRAELATIDGVEACPSDANFLWIHTRRPAAEVFGALAERGILVRSFHQRGGRLLHQLRVSVGTPLENTTFLRAMREVA